MRPRLRHHFKSNNESVLNLPGMSVRPSVGKVVKHARGRIVVPRGTCLNFI